MATLLLLVEMLNYSLATDEHGLPRMKLKQEVRVHPCQSVATLLLLLEMFSLSLATDQHE